MPTEIDKALLVSDLITYLLSEKKDTTSLPSLILSLRNYLVLLFKNYCAYISALFNISSLVKAQSFSLEGLHSMKIFDLLFKPKTAREV